MQRGAGICLTKSDPEREEAAAKFVKWLTEPEKRGIYASDGKGIRIITGSNK